MPSNTSPRSSPNAAATCRAYDEAGSTPARCNPEVTLSHTCSPESARARAASRSSTTTRSVAPVSCTMRHAWATWPRSIGNAHVRSLTPARANTSASTSVDTVSPRAPCSSCSRPSSTHLCVFACGRSATPSCRARAAMCATFRSTTSRCSRRAGVSMSQIFTCPLSPCPFPLSRFPSFHDVERSLAPQDPAHAAVGTELRVLFLSRADPLVVPFGGRRGGLQLDREPAVRHQGDVAALRNAFLMVPQADQRPGTVTTVADGVGVDRAVDPRGAHLRERGREHFVPGAPGAHLGEQEVL